MIQNGKLYKIHQEHFGSDLEIIEKFEEIFHANNKLSEYIKESINSDFLIRIPDNCRNLDKCYFEIAEKIVENLNYDPSVDEGMWTKLTIDAFIYSMLKFFDSNLDVCCTITPTFNYGKKPDISVYWSNEHFHTTVCLMEASSRPFAAPDMLKKEGDW
ncbi:5523_t:CDS:2 [Entrophospora sp. SA101]|nr:12901_t:CDS:2 [Entrophospora sp. SA101]CAJ0842046.1 5523_t:CDS:2 [Entrophospora sp. SA101]